MVAGRYGARIDFQACYATSEFRSMLTPTLSPPDAPVSSKPSGWSETLAPYARPNPRRSALDLATSVLPYIALWVLMYLSLSVSYLLTLALAVPAAGFAVRSFIVFHDCTHGSFMRTKRANAWVGTIVGVIVFQCFRAWKHEHAIHHATAGDLDRRGVGDVDTMTLAEYESKSRTGRLAYRVFRNPLVMFGIGPFIAMLVAPRIPEKGARPRIRNAVYATNAVLVVLVAALCWLIGWQQFLEIQVPILMISGASGIWLFYVQHQFEDAYWESAEEWSYADAALRGSSYLKLPKVLQFFTGNIGLHHVHHLSARIPNYNLQRAHDDNPIFHEVPVLSLVDGLRAVRLKVYDEDQGRMVTWAQARRSIAGRTVVTAQAPPLHS
jgi:acyl-lipid omega-6 desaturase (Delta-12 desaturase)